MYVMYVMYAFFKDFFENSKSDVRIRENIVRIMYVMLYVKK